LRQGTIPTHEVAEKALPISVALSNNGQKVLIGDSDGNVSVWEFGGSKRVQMFKRPESSTPKSEDAERIFLLPPSMNRDATIALVPYSDGLLYLADLVTGQLKMVNSPEFIQRLVEEELPKKEANSARLRGEDRMPEELREMLKRPVLTQYGMTEAILTPNGCYAVTARYGEAVRVWDMITGDCIHTLPTPDVDSFAEGEVISLEPMSDSQGVVFTTQDGRIHIWRFAGSSERIILPRDTYNTRPMVAVSTDGEFIVFGGWFDPLELWHIPTQRMIRKYGQNPDACVKSITFTRDGAYIVVASDNETLKNEIVVWDVQTAAIIAKYPLPSNPACLSEVSEDGRLVCLTDNGEVHYLSLENAGSKH
jgi:WD40 repeat protein